MQDERRAIGIDLGTTHSVCAWVDAHGRPTTLVNREGGRLTPSSVLFDGDDVIVGAEAVKALATETDAVADAAKRDIGRSAYRRPVAAQTLPPEVLLAYVLKRLRDDATEQLGACEQAVVTVPAYYDEARRRATYDAAYMAGLDVLDLINEPTAAAIAFGYEHGFLNQDLATERPTRVLVYDLGGGTFDVTLMEMHGKLFSTLATDGDVELGGRDWNARLMGRVADEYKRLFSSDPRENATGEAVLRAVCDDARHSLTSRRRTVIEFTWRGQTVTCEIDRDEFEQITADLLERTRFTTREVLREAGMDWSGIDRVIAVGGATRMPQVTEMLSELTGKQVRSSVAADEAVAHGAALYASVCLAEGGTAAAPFAIRNVNSHSLGVVAANEETGEQLNARLIPRNTPLPFSARRTFATRETGQSSVLVEIVEGESRQASGCSPLGRCVIRGLPADLPAGTPIRVDFRYGSDGRLSVRAEVGDTGCAADEMIERPNRMSATALDAWRQRIGG